jgi:hypothetical protein
VVRIRTRDAVFGVLERGSRRARRGGGHGLKVLAPRPSLDTDFVPIYEKNVVFCVETVSEQRI